MEKRIIRFVISLVMVVMVNFSLPVSAEEQNETIGSEVLFGETGRYGELEYEVNEDGTVTINSLNYNSSATNIEIPGEIEGKHVTSIGNYAFAGCDSLISISMPEGLRSIGDSAFSNCSNLTSISLPDSLTSIGCDAFYNTGVYKDESSWVQGVLYIDNYLVDAKKDIEYCDVKNECLLIGDFAFQNCDSLTGISIPDSVTSIGKYVFYQCKNLTSISLPEGLRSIGDSAFQNCDNLTSVSISDSVMIIGDYAFYGCHSLTSISLPEGLRSIGDSAFQNCDSLISISIPDSVMIIGDYAFYGCHSLTNISLPDGLRSIGNSAFYWCESLTSISIPDSVISIDNYAFCGCDNLTSISMPDSVTSIGYSAFSNTGVYNDKSNWVNGILYIDNYLIEAEPYVENCDVQNGCLMISDTAFSDCISLININFPNSVTIIGDSAFANCISLTSIRLPDNLISIGDSAFYRCESLASISFPGSLTSIGDSVFSNCKKLTSVSLPDSLTSIGDSAFANCNSLTSISLPDSVRSVGVAEFRSCSSLTSISIPDGVMSIGENAFDDCSCLISISIPDSVTSIGDFAFRYCDNLTNVYYSGIEEQWNGIDIGKNGNINLTGAKIHYNSTMPVGTVGNTNSTSFNAPIITSAAINGSDIFTTDLIVDQDSVQSYSISGTVDPNGCSDVHLYITQGTSSSVEIPLDTGAEIKLGEVFSPGKTVYMTAIDKATGKSTSKKTKLTIAGSGIADGSLSAGSIDLIDDFSIDIPEEVPVLGEQTFGLSLGSVPIETEIDGNNFKVSVGTDFFEADKGVDGKWKKDSWEGFKQGVKSAKDDLKKNSGRYYAMKQMMEKYNGKSSSMELNKGIGADVNITGYLEGYIDDNGVHPTEGGIIVSGKISYMYQGMTIVVVVPIYYEIGAGGELTFVGGVKDLVPGSGLQGAWTGSITPAVSFEVGGGVGVPAIFTAGISGKVKAELEIALDRIYQKLDVTGTASFKLTGPFGIEYKKPFAEGTFHVYETGNPNTLLGQSIGLYSQDDIYSQIDLDVPVSHAPHDDSTQIWVGNMAQVELMADYSNQIVHVLEEDSHVNLAPVFSNMDGKNVIAWITDNKDRTNGDKDMLVYSFEENGVWSAPQPVYDDGFADSSPVMKDGYIVWQKAVGNISEGMTERETGALCDIYIAKWNGSGFDEPTRVTENSIVDQMPKLAVNNGHATVVWMSNSENDFTGLTGENKLMSYTNGETVELLTTDEAITNYDCAYIDGAIDITYETDSDKNFNTIEDRELYNISGDSVTENAIADTHPVYGYINGQITLFYYSNGKIIYLENGEEKTAVSRAVTDQFTVISNGSSSAVIWTAVNDGSAELHGTIYNGSEWSEDICVTELGQRIKHPSAVMMEDGSIFAAFNRTEKLPDGNDYYIDGKSDLCTIRIVPSYDLELTDTYFDETTMTAYATLKNTGELDAHGIELTLTDSDTVTIDALKAGASMEVEMAYKVPETLTPRAVTLAAVLTDGDEYNTKNNSVVFDIGNADISVTNITLNETKTGITSDISNIGYADAAAVKVQLRDSDAEGIVLDEQVLDIAAGESQTVTFNIDVTSMHFWDANKQLYVTAEGDFEEVQMGNNDAYVLIPSPHGAADYETDILNYSSENGKTVINSVAVNNTTSDVHCDMYTAVYDNLGELKGVYTVKADIGAENDTGVDITVSCNLESGDTIKTFMWKGQEPLSKAAEIIVD